MNKQELYNTVDSTTGKRTPGGRIPLQPFPDSSVRFYSTGSPRNGPKGGEVNMAVYNAIMKTAGVPDKTAGGRTIDLGGRDKLRKMDA